MWGNESFHTASYMARRSGGLGVGVNPFGGEENDRSDNGRSSSSDAQREKNSKSIKIYDEQSIPRP